MTIRQPTEESFLKDVETHQLKILRNDGVYRHLRFKRPDSGTYYFDIVTWPGFLAISGDMGEAMFSRVDDMFMFFRMGKNDFNFHAERKLNINVGYWSEKLLAGSKEGIKRYESELFHDAVKERYDRYCEDKGWQPDDEMAEVLWQELTEEVLNQDEFEYTAFTAANQFESNVCDFSFSDFWETNLRAYTYHHIWQLYAIAYAVDAYDRAKAPMDTDAVEVTA